MAGSLYTRKKMLVWAFSQKKKKMVLRKMKLYLMLSFLISFMRIITANCICLFVYKYPSNPIMPVEVYIE